MPALPSRLYAILDLDLTRARGVQPLDLLDIWLDAGVRLVQLRAKSAEAGELLTLADEMAARCRLAGAMFIVNDRADIAAMSGADGVHVGQDDLLPSDVRKVIGAEAVVGYSTHTEAQFTSASAEPASYLAIGPVFGTTSKAQPDPTVGIEMVEHVAPRAREAGKPLVAIGGITLETAPRVLAAGADAVAVISDLLAGDLRERARAWLAALAVILFLGAAGCAGTVIGRSGAPAKPVADALLVLPGFGYTRDGEHALKSLAPVTAAEGVDLYVPAYISRSGLAASRTRLKDFIREQRLDRYQRVHVFAFIAGAWTLNPIVADVGLSNLASVVYDRSPMQERAPRIAMEDLHFLTWLKYGSPVFDVARTPYPPLTAGGVKVGLMVETKPTAFVRKHEAAARRPGPLVFECGSLQQRYDDCVFLAMSHDDLYTRFSEVWPDVLTFIRTGRFSEAANRTPPAGNPFDRARP